MTTILSQWYRERAYPPWFPLTWRQALRTFASGVPVLVVDNGGPTAVPYEDVEVVPAVDMLEHGRGTPGHYINCWRSMAHGFKLLADRGEDVVIFIGQHLFPGVPFVAECEAALVGRDLLMNTGCLNAQYYFTEYMAARPASCMELWDQRLGPGGLLEGELVKWAKGCYRVGPFPAFYRPRDAASDPAHTFAFHEVALEDFVSFAKARGFYRE